MSRTDHPNIGIALMCLAMLVLAGMDSITKHLAVTYPVTQILAVRFSVFTLFAVFVLCRGQVRGALRTAHPGLQIIRSLVICLEVGVFVVALRLLPIADVHAIAGVAPLMVTALSVLVLREQVHWKRWFALAAGLAGLLIILRPGLGTMQPAALIPLAGAALWAVYQILVRRTSGDSPGTQLLYMALVGTLVCGAIAPFQWVTPDATGWFWLLTLGLVGSIGHWLLIRALGLAPASALQPYAYTVIVWATTFGFLIYAEFPDQWTIAGGLIVVASGLYSWYLGRDQG